MKKCGANSEDHPVTIYPGKRPQGPGGWEDNDRRMYDNVDEDDIVDTLFGEK